MDKQTKKDLPKNYIVIIKNKFVRQHRTNTMLGRAFVIDTNDERSVGAFSNKVGTHLYGYWLSDTKRELSRIDLSFISIRDTKAFYAKYLPELLIVLSKDFYLMLTSVLNEWVVEDDKGEQTKIVSHLVSSKPLIDAYFSVISKTKEEEHE